MVTWTSTRLWINQTERQTSNKKSTSPARIGRAFLGAFQIPPAAWQQKANIHFPISDCFKVSGRTV